MEVRLLVSAVIASCLFFPATSQLMFIQKPMNMSVSVGETFSLNCKAVLVDDVSSVLSYKWQKNGTPVRNTSISLVEKTSMLTIESATLEDDGMYNCTASIGDIQCSIVATVNVTEVEDGLSEDLVTAIVVSVMVGVIALLLLTVVIFAWLSMCLHKGHIWERCIPQRYRSKVRKGKCRSPVEDQGVLMQTKRSRSLGQLFTSSGRSSRKNSKTHNDEDPYDRHLSRSTELLLSGEGNYSHPPIEETLDHDLHLDERLFSSHGNRAISASNIGQETTKSVSLGKQIKSIPVEDLSKQHRRKSDPYFKVPSWSTSTSLRTSVNSSCGDIAEEESDAHSQTSSLMKNVRFDLGDSGVDLGIVTGSSTPQNNKTEKRRSSAPEIQCVNDSHSQRESAHSKCHSKLAVETENSTEAEKSDGGQANSRDSHVSKQHTVGTSGQQEGTSTTAENYLDDKVASLVSVVESWCSVQSENIVSEDNTPQTPLVSEMRLPFQNEFDDEKSSSPQNRFRTRSISKLVTETTQQLLKKKESTSDLNKSKEPGKLKGLKIISEQVSNKPSSKPVAIETYTEPSSKPVAIETYTEPSSKPVAIETHTEYETSENNLEGSSIPSDDYENMSDGGHTSSTLDDEEVTSAQENDDTSDDHSGGQTPEDDDYESVMKRLERERLSTSAMPLFMCPVPVSPWKPQYVPGSHDAEEGISDSDSDEDDLMAPLQTQTARGNISPFGKGFISSKLRLNTSVPAVPDVPGSEVFVGSVKTVPLIKKGLAGRLTSIPEESPQASPYSPRHIAI